MAQALEKTVSQEIVERMVNVFYSKIIKDPKGFE